MKKNDEFLLIAIIFIVGLIYISSQGWIQLPDFSIVLPESQQNINVNIPSNTSNNSSTGQPVGDLRLVAGVWVAATDAEAICNELGGIWHFEQNWVGCEGVGAYNCSTNAHLVAAQQCIGAGGNWVCSLNNIYCKK